MRTALAPLACLLGLAACGGADTGPRPAAARPHGGVLHVGCLQRIEAAPPWPTPAERRAARRASIVLGDVTFWGLRQARTGLDRGMWKSAIDVRAGRPVTVRVAAADRDEVALDYKPRVVSDPPRLSDGWTAVRFTPCPPRTKRFSRPGRVGHETSFAGGFIVARPVCAELLVSRAGAPRPTRVRVAFGVRCAG